MAIISKMPTGRGLVHWDKLGLLLIASGACLLVSHADAAPSVESAWRSGEMTIQAQSNSGENTSTDSKETVSADKGSKEIPYATVIQGVNSAGTVRVNNLANIEVWLKKGGYLLSWGLMIWGVIIAREGKGKTGAKLITCGGVLLMALGPVISVINWLIASARDAGLLNIHF
jgi:hypothetical protein